MGLDCKREGGCRLFSHREPCLASCSFSVTFDAAKPMVPTPHEVVRFAVGAPCLSDEVIDRIWHDTPAQGDPTGKLFYRYFARAIEAHVRGVDAAQKRMPEGSNS
jgi:hypothetical protein